MNEPIKVRVNADQVSWPARCACCRVKAETLREISYTRRRGTKVVTDLEWKWQIPYCNECDAHVTRLEEAEEELTKAEAPTNTTLSIVFIGVGVAAVCALWLLADPSAWLVLVIVLVLALGSLAGLGFYLHRSKENRLNAAIEVLEEAKTCSGEECACAAIAVEYAYRSGSGTVHTFGFHNAEYAEDFKKVNKKKLYRPGYEGEE